MVEKLLADRISAYKTKDRWLRNVSSVLQRPLRNHSPDDWAPAIERFVFTESDDKVVAEFFEREPDRISALAYAQFPCVPCWIEIAGIMGWLVDRWPTGIVCDCFWGAPSSVLHLSQINFDQLKKSMQTGDSCDLKIYKGALAAIKAGVATEAEIRLWAVKVAYFAAVLTQPHAATIERVVRSPKGGDAAQRAMFRRRMQRSGGMFSFNVVHFSIPSPAKSSSVVRDTVALTPKRAHLRMGHWRLIEGRRSGSPYFVWVDPCEAGNAELGRVVKERHVSISTSSVRRGFVVPATQGQRGDTIPATKAEGGQ